MKQKVEEVAYKGFTECQSWPSHFVICSAFSVSLVVVVIRYTTGERKLSPVWQGRSGWFQTHFLLTLRRDSSTIGLFDMLGIYILERALLAIGLVASISIHIIQMAVRSDLIPTNLKGRYRTCVHHDWTLREIRRVLPEKICGTQSFPAVKWSIRSLIIESQN